MMFTDRNDAAIRLSQALDKYRDEKPLVLAIPRGAVPLGRLIAEKINGDFDVVLVHKIGAPDHPEYAIGSVSEFGSIYRTEAVEYFEIPTSALERQAKQEIAKLREKRAVYSPLHPPIDPKDRTVIIVDDGIATGSTMLAAIRAIRFRQPLKIVVASPVAPEGTYEKFKNEANEIILLETPSDFRSIGQFYEDFSPVSDEDVIGILREDRGQKTGKRKAA